jgi:di- and tripeptidase
VVDELVLALREFVAYRSVSSNPACAGECSQAATFLRKQFSIFHADTTFLTAQEGINPILLAGFCASSDPEDKKTVLFYGHYDVVDAQYDPTEWHVKPFQLHPLNGYLYGRGVTDNKAPILAALYAVADLARHGKLTCNVVFLVEGEEESGSRGFVDAVRRNRKRIGNVDFILLANSYWLDDHIPCLTYGMRGVIHVSMTVASGKPDRHSGMDGKSSAHEPLKDLMLLLSALSGPSGTSVMIPNFYHGIAELTEDEMKRYSEITSNLTLGHSEIKDAQAFTNSLIQRWREPNLTIHRVEVPESKTAVTIPRFATAALSIRIVPGQDAEEIAADLISFSKKEFRSLGCTNQLEVRILSMADAWLGDPSNEIFQALESAITQVWTPDDDTFETLPQRTLTNHGKNQKFTPPPSPIQVSPPSQAHRRASTLVNKGNFNAETMPRRPLYIREGGSIPAISFLEREFGAPAAMFPMGQASDNAHLGNERMRVENLYKGREVFKRVFAQL